MGAYGQATTGYWPAALIGAVLLLTFIVSTTTTVVRRHRRHHRHAEPAVRSFDEPSSHRDVPVERYRGLIAEAFIVRERMSGQIDTGTYQARMTDLAQEARREGRAHRHAR